MKSIRRLSLTILSLTTFLFQASATWSIIVVDPVTKTIGIAGASCTYSVYGIGAIVPGKGAVVVQAMSHPLARLKGLQMIMADASPQQIMEAMKDPEFDPEEQQYAVICVSNPNEPQTYTGAENPAHKGTLTAKGLSVQGNTLAHPDVIKAVLNAAVKAQQLALPVEEVLLLALEAGATAGGDRRCGSTKASSAFLTVAHAGDSPKKPYLNLVVYGTDENVAAVGALRQKFDRWKNNRDD